MARNFRTLAGVFGVAVLVMALAACASETIKEVPVEVVVEKEVIKEVAVEREVIKEVPVERIVEKEIVKEVPVDRIVEKEIVREVPVEKQVVKEVPVVVEKEVIKEVPVEVVVEKEVIKEVPVEVVVEREVVREVAVVATPAPATPATKEVVVVKEVPVGKMVEVQAAVPMEHFNVIGGSATVNDAPYDVTFFKHYGVNPFIDTEDDHLSTFAMDVDTASYTVARRFVQDGNLPNPDSVRVEEFVNFFDQGYEPPAEDAFAIHIEGSPSPFGGDNHWLMRVGLQGKSVTSEERKDASLVFAIDVSGSMGRENRLGLVKGSLRLLVDQLRPTDEVGIVVYGSNGHVLLQPTSGGNKEAIMEAVNRLTPGGSTYVEEGLRLAYEMAVPRVQPGRITRVILLSDGVGNVGRTGSDSILKQIRSHVEEGVTLTTVGFGMGNYNDILMERLANDGNGTYHYVDSLTQARRIFVENLTGTLQVIAKDAKIQVDFNPEVVSRYRLLGYENRRVADEDFRNDSVDAGEVGADHSVTALYEIKLRDSADGRIGTVQVRYQDPDTLEVTEISREFQRNELATDFRQGSARFQMAAVVAEYAEILRESYWAQDGSLEHVVSEAWRVREALPEDTDVVEFVDLVTRAYQLKPS